MTTPTNERRGAPRAHADLPLRLSPDSGAQSATLKDISTSGLCCRFGEPLTEMTMVQIQLELPGAGAPCDLKGVIVRCDKVRGITPPTYEVAVYFTDLTAETRTVIASFVESQLQAQASR